jgi:hypothetical protein
MSALGARVQRLRTERGIGMHEAAKIARSEELRERLDRAEDAQDLKEVLRLLIDVVLDLPT